VVALLVQLTVVDCEDEPWVRARGTTSLDIRLRMPASFAGCCAGRCPPGS